LQPTRTAAKDTEAIRRETLPSTIIPPSSQSFLPGLLSENRAFRDSLRWSISAAQTKIDWVSTVLMHISGLQPAKARAAAKGRRDTGFLFNPDFI
jgi:hypothetical protein